MAKMYTLDNKLLCGCPEVRIGDEIFPVDDRKPTVDKILNLYNKKDIDEIDNEEATQRMDQALELALGNKALQKISSMKISWKAYSALFELVLAAATGEDPKNLEERFPKEGE